MIESTKELRRAAEVAVNGLVDVKLAVCAAPSAPKMCVRDVVDRGNMQLRRQSFDPER